MEDAQIIELYWARNEDAIKETDLAYGRRLHVLADKIVCSHEDAEESVSDTYMKAWNTIPPQRPNYFFAYLAKICRFCAYGILDAYTRDQVEQVFSTLQLELVKTKIRFLQDQEKVKKRFSLGEPYEVDDPVVKEDNPAFVIPLPDGTYLRAVGFQNSDYPCINIYWDNGVNELSETLCFAEFNPEKEGSQKVCIGAYRAEDEDTVYYGPYFTVERNTDEQH